MVLVLVKGSYALWINDKHFIGASITICDWDGLVPDPEAFRAWINSGSNTKPLGLSIFVEQYSI